MSFLPKISIGIDRSRSTFNLGQDTHTTAEIGYVQPTFCRTIVPGSSMNISSRSIVRLSPMAVPTMGRLSLKNYYYFVDMSTLWTPFDCLREGAPYTYGDGNTSVPIYCPNFTPEDMFKDIVNTKYGLTDQYIRELRESIICTVYKNGVKESSVTNALKALKTQYGATYGNPIHFYPYAYAQGTTYSGVTNVCALKVSETDSDISVAATQTAVRHEPITNKSADFAFYGTVGQDNYQLLCKFEGPSKRLRKIFLGCGYSFNPFDQVAVTPFKLFAVYKAWFDTFAVQRTINWYHTECYKLIKLLSDTLPYEVSYGVSVYGSNYNDASKGLDAAGLFTKFVARLADICYNLPADYFSATDLTAQRGANFYGTSLYTPTLLANGQTNSTTVEATYQQTPRENSFDQTKPTAIGQQMAQVLLKYVNKRSVVGRKIADLLRLNGETDLHNNEHENVHHLGDDKTDINISDVMSLASTQDAALGDYAGRGVGMGTDDSFRYDTKAYGFLICLSCIVPKSGYFQGMLRENRDNQRFDFFTDEFDALGYQTVEMNELVADSQFATAAGDPNVGTNLGSFGLTPRYQHLKVGRNIVNGDMSLPSLQDVMLPYSLDRHFITKVTTDSSAGFKSITLPSNTPETFRQIRANDAYGDYNRIFQYTGNDYDHFIIQQVFDVKVSSPMKSISESYDTFDEENDNSTIEAGKM